jgi:hypothetical protein
VMRGTVVSNSVKKALANNLIRPLMVSEVFNGNNLFF